MSDNQVDEVVVAPVVEEVKAPKTYSEDYVKELREEAKAHRLSKIETEKQLNSALAMFDGEGDLTGKVESFKKTIKEQLDATLAKSKELILKAEIKGLDGYNHKLVTKLLDKNDITVDDDGKVIGLDKALAVLEIEFPEIKKVKTEMPAVMNAPAEAKVSLDDELAAARKRGDFVEVFKIFERMENK